MLSKLQDIIKPGIGGALNVEHDGIKTVMVTGGQSLTAKLLQEKQGDGFYRRGKLKNKMNISKREQAEGR